MADALKTTTAVSPWEGKAGLNVKGVRMENGRTGLLEGHDTVKELSKVKILSMSNGVAKEPDQADPLLTAASIHAACRVLKAVLRTSAEGISVTRLLSNDYGASLRHEFLAFHFVRVAEVRSRRTIFQGAAQRNKILDSFYRTAKSQ